MNVKNKEPIEIKIQKLRSENQSLREKIAHCRWESRQYERSLRKRDLLFNSLPSGIVLIQQAKIIEINDTILSQLGYRSEDVLGHDFLDFIHPDQVLSMNELLSLWTSGRKGPDQCDARLMTKDNHSILYDIKMKPLRFNNRKALLLSLAELEKREELEKANLRSKKTEALLTMASGLKEELRPHTDSLVTGLKELKNLTDQGHRNSPYPLEALENCAREFVSIAGGLEILSGEYDYSHDAVVFDLNECVKEVLSSNMDRWDSRAERLGIKIHFKTYLRSSSRIAGDSEGIREVIIHMMNNAVESMPDGGDILITTEDNAGSGHIYIQDSGIGISKKIRERLFDPYFTTKDPGSRGLGLSLSHAIIKRHRGDIEISGQEGHGIMVHILLPITRRENASKPVSDKRKIEESQILIILDEDVTRELLSHLLFTKGCRVDTAADGIEGLGKLKRKKFDLMIADVNAFHLEEDIFVKKCVTLHPDLSIVLITEGEKSVNLNRDYESMVDLNIIKPLVVNRLVKRVMALLVAK